MSLMFFFILEDYDIYDFLNKTIDGWSDESSADSENGDEEYSEDYDTGPEIFRNTIGKEVKKTKKVTNGKFMTLIIEKTPRTRDKRLTVCM